MKRNLTIQLDDVVINDVKAVAARRGTSVSGLVSAYLSRLATDDAAYERARCGALELLGQIEDAAADADPPQPTTGGLMDVDAADAPARDAGANVAVDTPRRGRAAR